MSGEDVETRDIYIYMAYYDFYLLQLVYNTGQIASQNTLELGDNKVDFKHAVCGRRGMIGEDFVWHGGEIFISSESASRGESTHIGLVLF